MVSKGHKYTFLERCFAWVLENGLIWAVSTLRIYFTRYMQVDRELTQVQTLLGTFFTLLVGNMMMIETVMVAQHFLIEVVYSHFPYFEEKQHRLPKTTLDTWLAIKEWSQTNFSAHMCVCVVLTSIVARVDQATKDDLLKPVDLDIASFLFKFAIVRVSADISFYAIHRALHEPFLYKLIHSRHHEHFKTRIQTNLHFTVLDLFLEGFVPTLVGIVVVAASGLELSFFESSTFALYINWYEIGSHSGKSIPTVSYFPPLSVLYNSVLPFNVDAGNVHFHERHHNIVRCNYGITQWCDFVLGTNEDSTKAAAAD
jgi:methylsterol monooxygenase